MSNNKGLYIGIIILVLVAIGAGLFFLSNNSEQKENTENQPVVATQSPVDDKTMVDCGTASDPMCFVNRMNSCLPVTVKMIGSDNTTAIVMTILGIENETCHFERKINNVVDMNCFFPKGTMNMDILGQTLGNDKGLQKIVDDACKKGW